MSDMTLSALRDPPSPPAQDDRPSRADEPPADQVYLELRLRDGTAICVPIADKAGPLPRD
jgi:hypothetical protein